MVASTLLEVSDVDREIEQRVRLFLADRQYSALRALAVESRGGVVTLRGRVNSFYEKQLSFLLSSRVAGVTRLVDEIAVAVGREPLQSLLHLHEADS